MKKYFDSIGLKNYIKKKQQETANDPYKLEVERYRKAKPSDYNSQEKLEKLFPLIAKRNPWPTKEEAKVKGAAIFGLKGSEKTSAVTPINLWEQWQKEKLALYDAIQDALDASEDSLHEADLPFSSSIPQDRPLAPEDLALLSPEVRAFAAEKTISFPVVPKSEPEDAEARTYIADYVSRELEIVAGELYNSPDPVHINPFGDRQK